MTDIFKFWSQIDHGQYIHPADKTVFDRIDEERHGFIIKNCLPAAYMGRLKSAPVVLLYLSPGFSDDDEREAKSAQGKDYYTRRWTGDEPLPGPEQAGYSWIKSRTKDFGDYKLVKDKVAVLNIGAYHSKNVKDYSSLLALPSSRMSIEWAQNVLFPDAETGKKIVICMRSASYWGLEKGKRYGEYLFAPKVVMGGYLTKTPENDEIKKLVRKFIEKS